MRINRETDASIVYSCMNSGILIATRNNSIHEPVLNRNAITQVESTEGGGIL